MLQYMWLQLRRARHIPPITLVPEIYIRNLKNRLLGKSLLGKNPLGENLLRKNLLSRPFLPDSNLSLSLSLSLLLSNPFSLCGLLRL